MGAEYSDVKNTQVRRITAERLLQSKTTIPHYYLTVDLNADKLIELRAQLNEKLAASGGKLSVNDFIVKASALVRAVSGTWSRCISTSECTSMLAHCSSNSIVPLPQAHLVLNLSMQNSIAHDNIT